MISDSLVRSGPPRKKEGKFDKFMFEIGLGRLWPESH